MIDYTTSKTNQIKIKDQVSFKQRSVGGFSLFAQLTGADAAQLTFVEGKNSPFVD